MKRRDVAYDAQETDVEGLQGMVEQLVELIDDAESRVNDIVSKMDIQNIGSISDIEEAFNDAKELADDLY